MADIDDDDDLLGPPPSSLKKERARRSEERLADSMERVKRNSTEQSAHLDITDTLRPVSISWLSQAFRMDRPTVKKRLAELAPIKYMGGNNPVYDFVQAASYLVKPKVNIADYIKKIRPEELPNELQSIFWDAKLKRQKFEVQAGDLWHTTDVIESFSEAFKLIKTSTQLWVSQLDRTTGLTAEQHATLQVLADQLLEDIHAQLTTMKDRSKTMSSRSERDPEDDDEL